MCEKRASVRGSHFRIGILVLFAAAIPNAVAQLIVPIEQERTVASTARAADDFYYDASEQADAAVDFGRFDAAVSSSAVVTGASGAGGAAQTSEILANEITVSGTESSDSEAWDFGGWSNSEGLAIFNVSFDLATPVRARIFGSMSAYGSTYAETLLVGPTGGIYAELAFGPDEVVNFDERLDLSAGRHRLFVMSDGRTWGDMSDDDHASGEYDVTFRVCPAADLDDDGDVGLADLATLLASYDAAGSLADGDLDGDGFVGLGDLSILLADFGSTCTLD